MVHCFAKKNQIRPVNEAGRPEGFIPVTPCSLGKRQLQTNEESRDESFTELPFRFGPSRRGVTRLCAGDHAAPSPAIGRPSIYARELSRARRDAIVRRMKNPFAVSALRARPVTALAALLATAALCNALIVGCGKKAENTEQTPQTENATPAPDTSASPAGGGQTAAGGDLGAQVYTQRCVLCHGATGHGDGPAAASLNPHPRNHTDGSYMNSRTDEQLLEVIRHGKGAMPAWGSVLSEEEIQAVLKHVRSLAVPPYKG
jgi:mono/diheme cytochrome c family protein